APPRERRPVDGRRRLRRRVRERILRRPRAAALRGASRLRALRVVSHRVRRSDPGHGLRRARAVVVAGKSQPSATRGTERIGPSIAVVGVLGFSFKAILIKLAYAWRRSTR